MGSMGSLLNYRTEIIATMLFCLSFFLFACRSIIIGSTLLDLQIQLQQDFATISRLVSAASAGHCFGSLSVGLLNKYVNIYVAMGIGVASSGIAILITPLIYDFNIVAILLFLSGIGNAVYDLYSHIAITLIWDTEKVGNAIQMMQMFFGLGALSCPAFVRHFLLPIPEHAMDNPDAHKEMYSQHDVQLICPFFVCGGASVVVGFCFFYYYFKSPNIFAEAIKKKTDKSDAELQEDGLNKSNLTDPLPQHPIWKINLTVLWVSAILHAFLAINSLVCSYVQAFGLKSSLKIEKRVAALIASTYWTSFSVTRLIFVGLTMLLSENSVFYMFLIMAVAGTIVVIGFITTSSICLWATSILLGAGFSPVFPVAFVKMSRCFSLTSQQTSLIFGIGILGDSIHSAIAGPLIENNPMNYAYYIGIISIVLIFLSATLPYACEKLFGQKKNPNTGYNITTCTTGTDFSMVPTSGNCSQSNSP